MAACIIRELLKILGVKKQAGNITSICVLFDLRISCGHHRNQSVIRLSITGRKF